MTTTIAPSPNLASRRSNHCDNGYNLLWRNLRFSCDKMALTEKDVCGGKVKCQTENNDGKYGKQSFESFSEAVRLDMQNACALTHCGILYKDEGPLVEAAEKALDTYPSYKATTESMAIVSIDIGTSLKLAAAFGSGLMFVFVSGMRYTNPATNVITSGVFFALVQGGHFMADSSIVFQKIVDPGYEKWTSI
ncbi:hypothetical protein E3N88_12922 [Mikania micrantha]|uniref:Uncharacterized protein n=1 Tax=Mikania micrantha TaxID=192012 RepID=A0A5N6P7A5_9ASTR|nr:hypothetical protein E3N88_12922 [Mikania micrantha]